MIESKLLNQVSNLNFVIDKNIIETWEERVDYS